MAKPKVFISSTFYDLRHVRADIERFIREVGYDPVLNEQGNIPYGKEDKLEEQYRTLLTNSSFKPREENIRLDFKNQDNGIIKVEFIIIDQVRLGHELTGEFIIDQSYLPKILDQTRSIIQYYEESEN